MIPHLPNLQEPIIDKDGRAKMELVLLLNALSRQIFNSFSTASGNVSQALPDAKTNFGAELIYLKNTSDAHTLTITGAVTGSVVLSSQGSVARFKSDGKQWWKV